MLDFSLCRYSNSAFLVCHKSGPSAPISKSVSLRSTNAYYIITDFDTYSRLNWRPNYYFNCAGNLARLIVCLIAFCFPPWCWLGFVSMLVFDCVSGEKISKGKFFRVELSTRGMKLVWLSSFILGFFVLIIERGDSVNVLNRWGSSCV